jgi:hypothetical protein
LAADHSVGGAEPAQWPEDLHMLQFPAIPLRATAKDGAVQRDVAK